MNAVEFKTIHRLESVLTERGIKLVGSGNNRTTNRCPLTEHKPLHLCVSINIEKQLWNCHDCKTGGDVITWIALEKNKTQGQVLIEAGAGETKPAKVEVAKVKPEIDKIYSYQNEFGEEVFQAIRLRPKSFRQRHRNAAGNWEWTMDGVSRVLYRLPELQKSETVAIAEGEKDAETLTALGFCGTCNVGGAGKWLDGYTDSIAGKHVVIFGDNDEAGKAHVKLIFNSIAGKTKSVKVIKIPVAFKDVTEYVESFTDPKEAQVVITDLVNAATPFYGGVQLPLQTMAEIEPAYQLYARNSGSEAFDLAKWLPSLRWKVRNLIAGEILLIIGDTGSGKTALLQSIALSALPLPTLFFQIELPAELLFERFVAAKTKLAASEVERTYATGDGLGTKALDHYFKNLFICAESDLSAEKIENIILKSELKIGCKPKLILLDYVQLVRSIGDSRYDRASNVVEDIKRLAKKTGTIFVISSQRGRPGKDTQSEVGLHDAKESGSLENSASVVIGAWRDKDESNLLHLKILKATKGGSGAKVLCNFDGEKMLISERITSPVQDSDVPRRFDE